MRRRTVLVGSITLVAGCPTRSQAEIEPSAHVTDWREDPARGLADPLTVDPSPSESGCSGPAMDALGSRIDARVDDLTGVSHGLSTSGEAVSRDYLEVVRTIYVEDGAVVLEPSVSFSRLRTITPQTISVASDATETDGECQWPVYVHDEVAYKS